jgi:adenosine deaminase
MVADIHPFIDALPKVELHVHLEGTLEPEQLLALAERNGVSIPYATPEAARAAYRFTRLQDFLDLYYGGIRVLRTEEDFYAVTRAYLERMHRENVRHVELFFDPQAHTHRGIAFGTAVEGIDAALRAAESEFGMSSRLIPNFLRHLSEEDGFTTLAQALPYRDRIHGFGLDSGELGNPPEKFARLFERCRDEGFAVVAHAGEEGPPDYVRQALDILQIDRLDHGNRSLEDPALVARLAEAGMTLTVCPLSNLALKGVERLEDHPLRTMLEAGLKATVNSDDPAYFGGYLTDNLRAIQAALDLTAEDLTTLARNAIDGAFLDASRRAELHRALDEAVAPAP